MTEQQQRELAAGLKALAAATRDASAGAHVERAVLAEMGRLEPAYLWRPALAGLAAALVLAVAGAVWLAQSSAPRAPQLIHPDGFVALPEAAALPDIESANIVRVSLPVAALPVYGVAIQPDVKAASVEADLLVAQDGQARAIRLVDSSNDSRSANND